MEYNRTKDTLYVKQTLGHKRIENSLIYVQLAEELFKDQTDYVSKVARTEIEACTLTESGFEFICDFQGHKLFRKRKTENTQSASPFVNLPQFAYKGAGDQT